MGPAAVTELNQLEISEMDSDAGGKHTYKAEDVVLCRV